MAVTEERELAEAVAYLRERGYTVQRPEGAEQIRVNKGDYTPMWYAPVDLIALAERLRERATAKLHPVPGKTRAEHQAVPLPDPPAAPVEKPPTPTEPLVALTQQIADARVATDLDLAAITGRILALKEQTAANIVEIGRLLISARERVGEGHFKRYVEEECGFSRSTAYRFIHVAEIVPSVPSMGHLEPTKVYTLLEAFGEEKAEQFASAPQLLPSTGEEKPVEDMTMRQLKEAIAARKLAEQRAAEAEATAREAVAKRRDAEKAVLDLSAEAVKLRNAPPQVREIVKPDPAQEAEIERLRQTVAQRETIVGDLQAKVAKTEADRQSLAAERDQLARDKQALEQALRSATGDDRLAKAAAEVQRYLIGFRKPLLEAERPLQTLLRPELGEKLEALGARDLVETLQRVATMIDNSLPRR